MNKRNTIGTSEMATISLYVSGQTELNDVTEFFQKRLMGEGENPIAFFDGVFYESHQERVGNIVFQDYLIYTDKAVYLWARGANKDYLDRFNLGSVSVNSRNKDSDFATLNLKIRREEKEPVYVIFDMVEISEAETITRLHTIIESTVEDYLGVSYRKEIPKDIAARILQGARKICPPQSFTIPLDAGAVPSPDAQIGYGQDLLEQYKASMGYNFSDQPQQHSGAREPRAARTGAPSIPGPQDAIRNLEAMLPTDPNALKRIASSIKDMVGEAPFKLRDQVMKDLQHIPNDVATVLSALNELLANIADNPQAERFVMNAIKTAVKNDGVLGSLGKIFRFTSGMGPGGPKKQPQRHHAPSHEDGGSRRDRQHADPDDFSEENTIRRKKISIRQDDPGETDFDSFAGIEKGGTEEPPGQKKNAHEPDDTPDGGVRRKKISIKADEESGLQAEIAQKLMSYDETARDDCQPDVKSSASPVVTDEAESGIRKKKISIRTDGESGAQADIAQKLMGYDETARELDNLADEPGPLHEKADVEQAPPSRREKIPVKTEADDESVSIPEDVVLSALGGEAAKSAEEYLTIESDNSPAETVPATLPVQDSPGSGSGEERGQAEPPSRSPVQENKTSDQAIKRHSVKVKSTQ